MTDWISVKDRLPSRNGLDEHETEYVLVVEKCEAFPYYNVSAAGYDEQGWSEWDNFGTISTKNITHWMPLPEPPQERKEDKC